MNPIVIGALALGALALISKMKKKPVGALGDASATGDPAMDNTDGLTMGSEAPSLLPVGPLEPVLRESLRAVLLKYGAAVARNVERIYRLETANFTSEQFRKTLTPGMKAFTNGFPFGWSLSGNGLIAQNFLPPIVMTENAGGGPFKWVRFKSLPQAIGFVGYFLDKYGNRPGRWRAGDGAPDTQAAYAKRVAEIPSPIVDDLI